MNDLISRQAAIKAAECIVEHNAITPYKTMAAAMDHLKRILNGMPPAQPEQKWIPCSERMPEEADGKVIICMPDQWPYNGKEQFHNAKHDKRVETACYSQHNDRWYFEGGAISKDRPVAWMPLPEPYEERKQDD